MSVGINTDYSNYNNYYTSVSKSKTQSASGGSSIEASKKAEDDMLDYYKRKYSDLKFSVGYNTKGAGSGNSGTGNVIMHPNLLKKMAADPEFAAKAENNIKHIPQAEAWKKNMCAANGMKLVSSGCFVDEDGNIAGSWSYVETANGNDDEKDELLEKLREKYLSEKERMDKLMTNRSEHQKPHEEILQFYQGGLTANAYGYNRQI